MNRQILASFAGSLLFAQAAWAADPAADFGRFQVIPNALVPSKGGKMQEQAILLDTATGRTWRMTPGVASGKPSGPTWVPIEAKVDDRVNSLAGLAGGSGQTAGQRTFGANTYQKRARRYEWDYEADP